MQEYLERKNKAWNESRVKQAELRFGNITEKENQSDMDYGG